MNGLAEPRKQPVATMEKEILPKDTVLIAGGGPVGLTLATVLAHYGVRSVILERNPETTRWPKMDLTNIRSMELFRKLGLADELRKLGVASHLPYRVLVSTSLWSPKPLAAWEHAGVDDWRVKIAANNDGTMPLEPWQRLSQALFEKWLKNICDNNPLIDVRFGWKLTELSKVDDRVIVAASDASDVQRQISSTYLIGCDGGSSRVRRSLKIPLDGGPMPIYGLLIHFKSRDLTRLHKHGRFWHMFFLSEQGLGSAAISQNEKDIFTTHLFMPVGTDCEGITSEDAVYRSLGGIYDPYPIKIDEVLVRSTYRPNIALARRYSGADGHIFLAGDAAHQNIPTGGYGMNMGIADAFELGWKLAAVINGHSASSILQTYEQERRSTALVSIERSGVHMSVHMEAIKMMNGKVNDVDAPTERGEQLRSKLRDYYSKNDGENTDYGIEMGYRYKSNIIIPDGSTESPWTPSRYIATTFPGARAPHVFLRDGTSIIDLFGKFYTLVEFRDGQERGTHLLVEAAWKHHVPLKLLTLQEEPQAHKIYERHLVLVRPDGHVAWRSNLVKDEGEAMDVFAIVSGVKIPAHQEQEQEQEQEQLYLAFGASERPEDGAFTFTSTVTSMAQTTNFQMENMGEFQA
ncbi:uncharacterized protein PV06_04142 [Exophiala oligosperma]|uniref:FAD-binding domain-containing protein n=1 Tax=Exophiala oligosperma TaxID=215243 RepID=A0A0D2C7J5_9EURO|nr:uncharacterized protein PV06_04142 [Exophiala oligosperma]KIW45787.1 hypothetical protein PV06_04142 [Exophiala oligosperma]